MSAQSRLLVLKGTEIHFYGGEQAAQAIVQIPGNAVALRFLPGDHRLERNHLLFFFKRDDFFIPKLFVLLQELTTLAVIFTFKPKINAPKD